MFNVTSLNVRCFYIEEKYKKVLFISKLLVSLVLLRTR